MRPDRPIIQQQSDTDLYMHTMRQLFRKHHPQVRARFAFHNRTKDVPLGKLLDLGQLREECEHARNLPFTEKELAHMAGTGLFSPDYIEDLRTYRPAETHIEARPDGTLMMECDDFLTESLGSEARISIVSELFFEHEAKEQGLSVENLKREGLRRTDEKIDKCAPYPGLRFMEFGTRRRATRDHQRNVLGRWLERAPHHVAATSNIALANHFGIACGGTMGHTLPMTYGALYRSNWEEFRGSQDKALQDFEDMYGADRTIALTDTLGRDYFFDRLTPEQAARHRGQRQDSGDPSTYGERQIEIYRRFGIDPLTKLFVPSNGLDTDEMIRLYRAFAHRIGFLAGIGTHMSNDLGIRTLSLVMKAVGVRATWDAKEVAPVKLTDDISKAHGPADDVALIGIMVGHPDAVRPAAPKY